METMTQIAQRIDDENRTLMKKNADLKIQYMSQENDRDLLLKQLIVQKKEQNRLRKLLDEEHTKADELEKRQEQENTINNLNAERSKSFAQGGERSAAQSNTIPDIINQRKSSLIKNTKSSFGGRQTGLNNISGLNQQNNSRRNISLTGGTAFGVKAPGGGYGSSNLIGGGSRPKTAAMPGLTGVPRPPTAAMHNFGKRVNTNLGGGPGAAYGFNFVGQ